MSTHSTVSRRRRAIARNATRQMRERQPAEDTDAATQHEERDTDERLNYSTAAASDAADASDVTLVPQAPVVTDTHTDTHTSAYESTVEQPSLGPRSAAEPATGDMPHMPDMPEQRRQITLHEPASDSLPASDFAHDDGYDVIDHRRQAMAAYQAHVAASSRHDTPGHFRDGLPTGSPFSWRERDWRNSRWRYWLRLLPAAAALAAVLLVAGTLAYVLATKAASAADARLTSASPQVARTPAAGLIVQPAPASTTPTPQDVPYRLGIWVSNTTVFVRATHEVAPVPGVPVTITINGFPYGPTPTDADGLARFNVSFGSASETNPAYITAACSISGQSLTATIDYIPSVGGPAILPGTPTVATPPVATPPVKRHP